MVGPKFHSRGVLKKPERLVSKLRKKFKTFKPIESQECCLNRVATRPLMNRPLAENEIANRVLSVTFTKSSK